jgi:hypothetical protein
MGFEFLGEDSREKVRVRGEGRMREGERESRELEREREMGFFDPLQHTHTPYILTLNPITLILPQISILSF